MVASQICAAALTAVRCCRSKPGFSRPARMFSIRKGWPVTMERARAVRRIWPPPSPMEPSMVIKLDIMRHLCHLIIVFRWCEIIAELLDNQECDGCRLQREHIRCSYAMGHAMT